MYVNFDSFTLWKWQISWIHSLVTRAKRICSKNYLDKEIQLIKNYSASNGYTKHIVHSIVKRALRDKESTKEESTTDTVKIFIDLKFSGITGDRIVKNCIKKLYKCLKKQVIAKSVFHYQTTKLCYFTNI